MAFSYARIILPDADQEIFKTGVELYKSDQVQGRRIGTAGHRAKVIDQQFSVSLGFARIGSPQYSCDCDAFSKNPAPCVHIVSSAIQWDSERNVPTPTSEELSSIYEAFEK